MNDSDINAFFHVIVFGWSHKENPLDLECLEAIAVNIQAQLFKKKGTGSRFRIKRPCGKPRKWRI